MPSRVQAAPVEPTPANLGIYRDPEVVSHYAALDYLTACERFLIDTYLAPGIAILDIGVGGGRTTPYLSRRASRYVGVDYSEEMIRLCRNKFPQLEFLVADASNLSTFSNESFDAIVFSFNGLDYVLPAEKRLQCLQGCARVLKPGGALIFSSHNPRSILVRPSWDPKILRGWARRVFPQPGAGFTTVLGALTAAKSVQAFLRALARSVVRIFRRVPTRVFWRGEGYLMDSVHGGLTTHYSTPRHVVAETAGFGLRFETQLGDDYPKRSRELFSDWYYYVFSKMERPGEVSCA